MFSASCGRMWLCSQRYASSQACGCCRENPRRVSARCSDPWKRSTFPWVCGCRIPLQFNRMPWRISHSDKRVCPELDCIPHHGVPWSINISSGTPHRRNASSSRSRTGSPRVLPLAAGAKAWADAALEILRNPTPDRQTALRVVEASSFSMDQGVSNLMALYELPGSEV